MFPTISTVTPTTFATSVTSMAVNMPAVVDVGDYLLAMVEVRNSGTFTPPSGWVELDTQLGGGSVGKLTIFYKVADGDEGGTTETFTASTGTSAIWQVRKVSGADVTVPPESNTASGDVSSANPPTLSPSWGADDNLWVVIAGHAAASATAFSGAPTNYTGFDNDGASSGGAACSVATAYRELNASTEDPGAFTVSNNRWWAAATVVFKPASGSALTVATDSATDVDTVGAQLNGEILTIGEENADARGFVYGTTSEDNPGNVAPGSSGYASFTTESGDFGAGIFDAVVSGLSPDTTYYVRAWAQDGEGYVYGDQVEFTTDALIYGISGEVTLSGTGVESAIVRCIRQSDNMILAEQTTDSSGAYSFTGLDSGELYHLAVEYETESEKYNVLSYWDIEPVVTN